MKRRVDRSLELWEKYGEHILMAMPYADNLIASGEGCSLQDIDGNQILDLSAGQFCSILGNSHPKYIEKLLAQTRNVIHTGTQFLSPIVLEAAKKFAEIAPGSLSKSIFLSTGTEANECAISLAKAYTKKTGVIGFNRGYYGLSVGTKALSAIFSRGDHQGSGPALAETFRLLAPHCFHCPVKNHYPECEFVCLDSSTELLPKHPDIAAIIVEPFFSAGGMFAPPPGYLKRLRDYAHQIGALLIVDEAQTGFGRTGKWFACEHHEVEPDILVVSKSSGAGFPVSSVITTDAIADRIASQRWLHLASHQSDPLPAAAFAATIDIVREEKLMENAVAQGRYFMDGLLQLKMNHQIIVDVRGEGLMLGAEIGNCKDGTEHELCLRIVALSANRGLHFTYSYYEPVFRFIPPLTITKSEIDRALAILDDSISHALAGDTSIDELLPTNHYSRAFVEKLTGKKTLKSLASLLYQTSPRYWVQKAREFVVR
jgi:2,2-dialkylglycine decarboxylase (pyruvate)